MKTQESVLSSIKEICTNLYYYYFCDSGNVAEEEAERMIEPRHGRNNVKYWVLDMTCVSLSRTHHSCCYSHRTYTRSREAKQSTELGPQASSFTE